MEARVSVVCCRWKVLSNGESPIMLKFTQGGVRRMKSLGISVKVEHWDFEKNLPKKKCPNSAFVIVHDTIFLCRKCFKSIGFVMMDYIPLENGILYL